MTQAKDLIALAERVEKAEGPDRELNDAIADALFSGKRRNCIKGLSDKEGGSWMWEQNGHVQTALRYTASIDAAMMLAGKDKNWGLEGWEDSYNNQFVYECWVQGSPRVKGMKTPALALTAAALRALAQEVV